MMHQPKPLLAAAVASVLLFTNVARAVPYASGITNTAGTVSFILNESADNVKIVFNGGASTNDLGAQSKGGHSFSLGAATSYEIYVTKTGPTAWTQISEDTNNFV